MLLAGTWMPLSRLASPRPSASVTVAVHEIHVAAVTGILNQHGPLKIEELSDSAPTWVAPAEGPLPSPLSPTLTMHEDRMLTESIGAAIDRSNGRPRRRH
jgi:hypothetical protein